MHGFGTGGQITGTGFSGIGPAGASGFSGLSGWSGTGTSGFSGFVSNAAINPQVGAYTLQAGDEANTLINMSSTGAVQLSIPIDTTYNFPVGTVINAVGTGTGGVITIAATTPGTDPTGTAVVSTGATPDAPVLRVQYSSASCIKIAANSWLIVGDIK